MRAIWETCLVVRRSRQLWVSGSVRLRQAEVELCFFSVCDKLYEELMPRPWNDIWGLAYFKYQGSWELMRVRGKSQDWPS